MEQQDILCHFLQELQGKVNSRESFASEFARLKRQSAKYKTEKTFPSKCGELPEHIKKNRYKDILPFDHSRVKLSLITSDKDTDYINASFIKGVYGPKAYIATQGPLPDTILDFWRMIWEYNVQVIVMACREFEMGRKKCEIYWSPPSEGSFHCGPFSVLCLSEEKKNDYIVRVLKATLQTEHHIIYQLHYVNWPDHDVPSSITSILEMIWEMRSYQEDDLIPICVHCSAGCGRTGAICAIDYTWKLLRDGIVPENFSIYDLIQEMRMQRPSLVQTKEQYELVYISVKHLFEKHLENMPRFQDASIVSMPFDTPQAVQNQPEPIHEPMSHSCSQENRLQENHFHEVAQEPNSIRQTALREEAPPLPSRHSNQFSRVTRRSMFIRRRDVEENNVKRRSLDLNRTEDLLQSLGFDSSLIPQNESPVPRSRVNMVIPANPVQQQRACKNEGPAQSLQDSLTFEENSFIQVIPVPQAKKVQFQENKNLCSVTPTVCLTVEDPYFSPVSPVPILTLIEPEDKEECRQEQENNIDQWTEHISFVCGLWSPDTLKLEIPESVSGVVSQSDEESPPPLPKRTPESFILASEDAPASPRTPPLPKRTPESLVLASEDSLPAVTLPEMFRFGTSAEWCGQLDLNSRPMALVERSRSKSLKVKPSRPGRPTFSPPPVPKAAPSTAVILESPSAPPLPEQILSSCLLASEDTPPEEALKPMAVLDSILTEIPSECSISLNTNTPPMSDKATAMSKNLEVRRSGLEPLAVIPFLSGAVNLEEEAELLFLSTPPQPKTNDELSLPETKDESPSTPPLPERTPHSFMLASEDSSNEEAQKPHLTFHTPRVGMSSEWCGHTQPKSSLGSMSRAKSLKVKSSRLEPVTVPFVPNFQNPPAESIAAEALPATRTTEATAQPVTTAQTGEKSNSKSMLSCLTRNKSIKFFKPARKKKPNNSSSANPMEQPPPGNSTSFFNFGST
ncbi:tyrosine-protein phosphatase non-receptor type 22-like isoform X2 [Polypterus senegalus]|uniref:tyrosine-protein phosphatase non-receptor type 22-like isoform X2 n=1 Tax=Polypterus senegalus TaxID=55291 RepID=UPI001964305C|nr:tyrosine-protein phosphatase non-receptor type 22-like isoform X2 [Polypterus senegalus]